MTRCLVPAGICTVRLILKFSSHVFALSVSVEPLMERRISYCVPGLSSTRLPRYSELRASNHRSRPRRQDEAPASRNSTFAGLDSAPPCGLQYSPSEWKVGTAAGAAAAATAKQASAISRRVRIAGSKISCQLRSVVEGRRSEGTIRDLGDSQGRLANVAECCS